VQPAQPEQDHGRYRIEALAKGLQVLSLFDGSTTTLRTTEMSARTDIPMPTMFRIVATLEEEGYLERAPDGSFQPGLAVMRIGTAALRSSSLLEVSDRPLRRLADATGETVNLGVLTEDRMLYLARLRNADLVTANVQVGTTLPAPYTSMGKLLLSYLPEEELTRRITTASFTAGAGPNAAAGPDDLRALLPTIRRQGWAIQDEELAAGLRSISAPVFGHSDQPVAAVNVAVSAARYTVDQLVATLRDPVVETAAEISVRLRNQ
jgi:IclR family pca regulon transcriptional regulator